MIDMKHKKENITRKNVTSILRKKEKEYLLNLRLLKAVEIDNLSEVQHIIKEGATLHKLVGVQLHKYNTEHNSLLHIAIKLAHIDIIKYLLKVGCDVNAQTRRLRAPLHYATYNNTPIEIIELLLEYGAIIEIKDDDNASAFMWACYLNNIKAAEFLLDKGADAYSSDDFSDTPIECASFQGNREIVQMLVKRVPHTKKQLNAAYTSAVENGQIGITKLISKYLNSASN